MRWWVFINNQCIGFVIAATEEEALQTANEKFAPQWNDIVRVEPKSLKRR